jgi:hypothetical protein
MFWTTKVKLCLGIMPRVSGLNVGVPQMTPCHVAGDAEGVYIIAGSVFLIHRVTQWEFWCFLWFKHWRVVRDMFGKEVILFIPQNQGRIYKTRTNYLNLKNLETWNSPNLCARVLIILTESTPCVNYKDLFYSWVESMFILTTIINVQIHCAGKMWNFILLK